jgi:hypothetical protein
MLFLLSAMVFAPADAVACDLCALYTARNASSSPENSFNLTVNNRFTAYRGTARQFAPLGNTFLTEQKLDSTIVQFLGSWQANREMSVQLSLPFIYRDYERLEAGRMRSGKEYGFGDLSALLSYQPIDYRYQDLRLVVRVYGGIKLPTGDDDRLKEEKDEDASRDLTQLLHGTPNGNLVDGADLALGSGSYDFPLGVSIHLEKERLFLNADLQVHLRTEGSSDFQYGNGLFFSLRPGTYLLLKHDYALSIAADLNGDFKDKDHLDGETLDGSAENLLFLGPDLRLDAAERFTAFLAWHFVLKDDNQETGVQPARRILAGISYRF